MPKFFWIPPTENIKFELDDFFIKTNSGDQAPMLDGKADLSLTATIFATDTATPATLAVTVLNTFATGGGLTSKVASLWFPTDFPGSNSGCHLTFSGKS